MLLIIVLLFRCSKLKTLKLEMVLCKIKMHQVFSHKVSSNFWTPQQMIFVRNKVFIKGKINKVKQLVKKFRWDMKSTLQEVMKGITSPTSRVTWTREIWKLMKRNLVKINIVDSIINWIISCKVINNAKYKTILLIISKLKGKIREMFKIINY